MSSIPCRDIIVEVTQEDIDKGLEGSAEYCPLARALRRQVSEASMVVVCEFYRNEYDTGVVEVFLGDWHKTWKPSKAIYKFVSNFDKGNVVKPHKFILKRGTQTYVTYKDLGCDVSKELTKEELEAIYGIYK